MNRLGGCVAVVLGLCVVGWVLGSIFDGDPSSPEAGAPPATQRRAQTAPTATFNLGDEVVIDCPTCDPSDGQIALIKSGDTVAAHVNQGDLCTVLVQSGELVRVECASGTGWLPATRLSPAASASEGEPAGGESPPADDAVTLWCPDCAEIGMRINLWDWPGGLAAGATVVAEADHGDTCTLLGSQQDFDEVRCGASTGWVRSSLVHR